MKPILFVVCFSLGVSLMVFSGYLPKAASARNGAIEPAGIGSGDQNSSTLTRRLSSTRTTHLTGRKAGAQSTVEVTEAADAQTTTAPTPPPTSAPRVEPPAPPLTESTGATESTASAAPPAKTSERAPAVPSPTEAEENRQNMAAALEGLDETTDETTEDTTAPVAEAGPDRVLWVGWDEIPLDGTGSSGTGLTYLWKQTRGATSLTLRNADQASATAHGLPLSTTMDWYGTLYEFQLTVTDNRGRQAVDTVQYVVLPAPEITITPAARRSFRYRDGYLLAHFESWTTSTAESATFTVMSPTELTFTKVTGNTYAVTGGRARREYLYQVTVDAQPGEPLTLVELLVDTAERVPGIIQFGVSWETR